MTDPSRFAFQQHKRSRARRAVLLVGFALSITLPAASWAENPSESFRIQVTDVDAHALVFLVADGMRKNVIVDPFIPRRRISQSETYHSITDFFRKSAAMLGGELRKSGPVYLIRDRCALPSMGDRAQTAPDSTLSVSFQDIELRTLLELLKITVSDLDQAAPKDLLSRRVTVRMSNVSRHQALNSLADSVGLSVQSGPPATAVTVLQSDCSRQAPAQIDVARHPPLLPRLDNCPYRAKSPQRSNDRPCQPLEFFGLNSLQPRGVVQARGATFGIVESPDGALHTVRAGDHMGRNRGRVVDVSEKEIRLLEVVASTQGEYQERAVVMSFASAQPTVADDTAAYVEVGSPQYRYNVSLGRLFAATERVRVTTQLCERHHPETAAVVEKAVLSWEARNKETLREITDHTSAYLSRRATDSGVPADRIREELRRDVLDGASEFVTVMGEASTRRMAEYCSRFAERLLAKGSRLEVQESDDLRVLRACTVESTCPNLLEN